MPTDDAYQALQRREKASQAKPRKTITGRVVYNRRLHGFTIKDWARIGRKVPPPTSFDEALTTVSVAFGLVRDLASYLFGWMPQYRISQLVFNEVKPIMEQALGEMQRYLKPEDKRNEVISKLLDLLGAL